MKPQDAPRLEERRAADFERELLARARTWIPSWSLDEAQPDFGLALLRIAARFSSEIAERLDVAGNKMALGFLDWLGLSANAARPARMPVVFKMTDTATTSVLAPHPIKLQVDVPGATVTFQTETDIEVIPGKLAAMVGADPTNDFFYLPPPGISSLDPLEPLPTSWTLKNFVAPGSTTLQLDPGLGLADDMLIAIAGQQYRIVKAKDDLVTIDPPVPQGDGFAQGLSVAKILSFDPFDGARNLQQHILYIGDTDLLNVEAEARIEVSGLETVPRDAIWEYWGKDDSAPPEDADARWRQFPPPAAQQVIPPPPLVLAKPKGSMETRQVGLAQSRWIRASLKTSNQLVTSEGVTLRVNPPSDPTRPPDSLTDPALASQAPPVDAFINATPSPTTNFYPLGREPKLFDTLYLGSAEAFSKAGATAWVQFDLGDSSFAALSAVRTGIFANSLVAGVGMDGALHLFSFNSSTGVLSKFRDREPLQPPSPSAGGSGAGGPSVTLQKGIAWQLPAWSDAPLSFSVAVPSGGDVWIWKENLVPETSGWIFGQSVPSSGQGQIDGLVFLDGIDPQLFALRDEVLYWRSLSTDDSWKPLDTLESGNPVSLKAIVPVVSLSFGSPVTSQTAGMVGVSSGAHPKLYKVAADGTCTSLDGTHDFSFTVRPAAGADSSGANLVVVAASLDGTQLLAHVDGTSGVQTVSLSGEAIGPIEVLWQASDWNFLASVNGAGVSNVSTWCPAGADNSLFESPRPAAYSDLAGGPLALPAHVLVPGKSAEIFIIDFDLSQRIVGTGDVSNGVVIPASSAISLLPTDTVALFHSGAPEDIEVTNFGVTSGQETFYEIAGAFSAASVEPLLAYRTSGGPHVGTGNAGQPDQFTLELNDTEVASGQWLMIATKFYRVTGFQDSTSNPRIVLISPDLLNPAGSKDYFIPILTGGHATAALTPNPAASWDAGLLDHVPLSFPGQIPDRQAGKSFRTDAGNHPQLIVLANPFTPSPGTNTTYVVDAASAAGGWSSSLGDTSANPELAWEYWNGTGWWQLQIDEDATHNLKSSGALRFEIPRDMASSEWAGKTNYWIRARLVGGDYGQETVKVVTKTTSANETEQTVERSTDGIQPPFAIDVRVAYAVSQAVVPRYVQTEDSGALRDQSDANRTAGPSVEIFMPLSVTLGRLDAPSRGGPEEGACVPDCACSEGEPSTSPATQTLQSPSADMAPASSIDGRRAIYLGFTSTLEGGPVKILFLAGKEGAYDAIAPLEVDALIGDHFTPVTSSDETRALGESGLVTMNFDVPPLQAELFGQALAWLRIAPRVDSSDWKPAIAGIYANGVWAEAAESMTRELLGSSGGQPALSLALARPPLLKGTLELRVREPLGDEERDALVRQDPALVRFDIPDLPGDWVLWSQVQDPTDWGPTDRFYALDEASGTITFGDGLHGMIPPAGVDCVVAFGYKRTDPAAGEIVPANFVLPRSELNLVSPVDSVETVIAADQSAGGVAPETSRHVLEFAPAKLRNGGRAVSAGDFEDLAIENSDEVLQARCFAGNGQVRLLVVVRGPDPSPSRAQQRELRRMLLEAAPVSLGAPGALTIVGPRIRQLRVALDLGVETLDFAGAVGGAAKARLINRFSTRLDRDEGQGWPLGLAPGPDDIAEILLDIADLQSILSIGLFELDAQGLVLPWPASIARSDLVMLAAKDIILSFEILEAAA